MSSIQVRYFALLKDLTGTAGEKIELPKGSRGSDLLKAVSTRHTAVQPFLSSIRLANESVYLSPDAVVTDEAVVLLIPPVSGG